MTIEPWNDPYKYHNIPPRFRPGGGGPPEQHSSFAEEVGHALLFLGICTTFTLLVGLMIGAVDIFQLLGGVVVLAVIGLLLYALVSLLDRERTS